jgi:hypothetical protein
MQQLPQYHMGLMVSLHPVALEYLLLVAVVAVVVVEEEILAVAVAARVGFLKRLFWFRLAQA